jgi:hypothetical protein
VVRNSGVVDVTAEESRYLNFGRVVDTTRLRTRFGYTPRYSTAETVESYLSRRRRGPNLALTSLGVGSRVLRGRRPRRLDALAET